MSLQIDMLMERLGELAAFDIDNAAGRYMLNLSRSLDRFMAMRLQVGAQGLVRTDFRWALFYESVVGIWKPGLRKRP